ncbi:MAG TPA: NAD(P)-dependent oxidoreductase [Rhizomicrobium sp.]|nr:NAD(P)-dependent oxidoreductase [Rhizomicrobium sp.]
MTILVTGSAGHLGEAMIRTLRAAGRDARGLDLVASPFTDHVGSVADRAFVRRAMADTRTVVHAATLHKPHIATHSAEAFVETNVHGTLVLLEEAVAAGAEAFLYTSTTSAFGSALTPAGGDPAAWITEDVRPIPKNIYGVTKVAAEDLCELFARKHRLPVIVLRTSRFFPESDDDPVLRKRYEPANAQANELLYRRTDIADIVDAHLLAIERASAVGFGRYIVSATTPFSQNDLAALRRKAAEVVKRLFPDCESLYTARGWSLFPEIDRVYVNARARHDLGWRPQYDFAHALDCLRAGRDFRSQLARDIGIKGYHGETTATGFIR